MPTQSVKTAQIPESIEDMLKRYPDEWLLFEVCERDEYGAPLTGILLAHSPDRDELDDKMDEIEVRRFGIRYSGTIPQDWEVILCG